MVHVLPLDAGRDLVLFSGLPQPPADLLPLARELAASFRVRLVFPPGWPQSARGTPENIEATSQAIADAVGACPIRCWWGVRSASGALWSLPRAGTFGPAGRWGSVRCFTWMRSFGGRFAAPPPQ